jgi:zinc protease
VGETIEGYAAPVHRTEVDGIPCFWADLPEEFEARLCFRVGAYDETLATRGTTHLIEHLAIADTPFVRWNYSAWVMGLVTTFSVFGGVEDVVDGLAAVCARLREPPLERVPATRRALLTEDSRTSAARRTLKARYGARGPGLAWYPEYGVRRVTQEHIADWTRERFTAGNAVLLLTGAPPRGLRCRLDDGPRWPTVAPEPEAGELPRLIAAGDEVCGVGYLYRPSPAESSAQDLVRNRVSEQLHYRLGIGELYRHVTEPLDPELWHRYVSWEFLEGHDDAIIELVLAELRACAEEGPTEDELATNRVWGRNYAANLDYGKDWLTELMEEELLGVEPCLAGWGEGYAALDAADVAEALAQALPTLVVESNTGIPADDLGLGTSPDWAHDPIEGTEFRIRPREGRPSERLMIGDNAVSMVDGDYTATVRVGDLAILAKSDDTRELIDLEGGSLFIEAAEWADGRWAFALIDALVPAELTVDMEVDGPEVPHFYLDGEA